MNKTKCEKCDHAIQFPDKLFGRKVKCPSCLQVIRMPSGNGNLPSHQPAAVARSRAENQLPLDSKSKPSGVENVFEIKSAKGFGTVIVKESPSELVVEVHPLPLSPTLLASGAMLGLSIPLFLVLLQVHWVLIFFITLAVVLIGMIVAALDWTTTEFSVCRDGIKKRISRLVPGLGKEKLIRKDEIQQLYVVETTERRPVPGNAKRFETTISYSIFLLHQNGWRYELVGKKRIDRLALKIIEQKIEGFIRLPSQPVYSTWYQRHLHGEKTLDQKSATPSNGKPIYGKSLWVSPTTLLVGLLAGSLGALILWWGISNNWDITALIEQIIHQLHR